MGKNSGECESTLSFEQLDLLMGDHAPFLIALSDGAGEELHLTISTADIGEKGENVPDFSEMDARSSEVLAGILSKARPITPGERQYDIGFTDYILYQTRNESFCSFDREEIRRGKYLIVFERSKLLDNLERVTDARQFEDGSYYPGKWVHYGIYTQNHVIDVIAHKEPVIRELSKIQDDEKGGGTTWNRIDYKKQRRKS